MDPAPIDFTIKVPDELNPGHALVDQMAAKAAKQLGDDLDREIRKFIEMCEGRLFDQIRLEEVAAHGTIVKMQMSANAEPLPWENFFVWKRGKPDAVLAYRFLTGTHLNDDTQAMTLDSTLQTIVLFKPSWPVPLAEYLAAGS